MISLSGVLVISSDYYYLLVLLPDPHQSAANLPISSPGLHPSVAVLPSLIFVQLKDSGASDVQDADQTFMYPVPYAFCIPAFPHAAAEELF